MLQYVVAIIMSRIPTAAETITNAKPGRVFSEQSPFAVFKTLCADTTTHTKSKEETITIIVFAVWSAFVYSETHVLFVVSVFAAIKDHDVMTATRAKKGSAHKIEAATVVLSTDIFFSVNFCWITSRL